MKLQLIFICLIGFSTFGATQNYFRLNSGAGDSLWIEVNGQRFSLSHDPTCIETNYPLFDTLTLIGDAANSNEKIICNFKPDSSYIIAGACCGSLDIIPVSRFSNDSIQFCGPEEEFYKIQDQFIDRPFISIRTRKNPKDSIYAWHADAACMTEHRLINSDLWRLGIPPKCFYWNNITYIQFFKTDYKMPNHEETDLEVFLGIKNIVELKSVSFRLFDNEHFVITFDERKNTVELEYE